MKSTLVSRRKALVRAAHAATVISLASGWSRTARGKVDPPPDPASDNQVLNALLAAEYDGVATYGAGAQIVQNETDESVRETVLAVATHFQDQHRSHAEALVELRPEPTKSSLLLLSRRWTVELVWRARWMIISAEAGRRVGSTLVFLFGVGCTGSSEDDGNEQDQADAAAWAENGCEEGIWKIGVQRGPNERFVLAKRGSRTRRNAF